VTGRSSSSGGITSGGGGSACTSHVHLGLHPNLPPPGAQPLAAPQPRPLPSGADVLRDVPYADAATLPLAPEDSFSEPHPAQEATLPPGAPLSAPAAAADALALESPRVQVALTLTLTLTRTLTLTLTLTLALALALALALTPTPTLSLTLTLTPSGWRCRGRPPRRLSPASRRRAARAPPARAAPSRGVRASVRVSRARAARAPHSKHRSWARSRQHTDAAARRRGAQAWTGRSGACGYVISSSCRRKWSMPRYST
jgi:hypothetical protein